MNNTKSDQEVEREIDTISLDTNYDNFGENEDEILAESSSSNNPGLNGSSNESLGKSWADEVEAEKNEGSNKAVLMDTEQNEDENVENRNEDSMNTEKPNGNIEPATHETFSAES